MACSDNKNAASLVWPSRLTWKFLCLVMRPDERTKGLFTGQSWVQLLKRPGGQNTRQRKSTDSCLASYSLRFGLVSSKVRQYNSQEVVPMLTLPSAWPKSKRRWPNSRCCLCRAVMTKRIQSVAASSTERKHTAGAIQHLPNDKL